MTLAEAEKLLLASKAKVQEEEIDPVIKFLKERALQNIQAIQTMAETTREDSDSFAMRKYLVSLAGFSEKQVHEHSGTIKVTQLEIDV